MKQSKMKTLFLLFVIFYFISNFFKKAAQQVEKEKKHQEEVKEFERHEEEPVAEGLENISLASQHVKTREEPPSRPSTIDSQPQRIHREKSRAKPFSLEELIFGTVEPKNINKQSPPILRLKNKSAPESLPPIKQQKSPSQSKMSYKKPQIFVKEKIKSGKPSLSIKSKIKQLNPGYVKEGILLAEILGSPLALRERSHSLWD